MVPPTPSAKDAWMEVILLSPVVLRTVMPFVRTPNSDRSSFNSPSADREKFPFIWTDVPAPPASASVPPSMFRFPVKKESWNILTMSNPATTVLEKEMAWSEVLP